MLVEGYPIERQMNEINFAITSVESHKMKIKNLSMNARECTRIVDECRRISNLLFASVYVHVLYGKKE